MFEFSIGLHRLHNQSITTPFFNDPASVVRWLGAIQAQDYLGSLWAIGLRMNNGTEAMIEEAVLQKKIVRSWPMRSTLHFVSAEDLRWLLKLTAPRGIAKGWTEYKKEGLSEAIFNKSMKIVVRALEKNKQMTRDELYTELEKSRVNTAEQRGLHIIGHLAQKGVICFGPRKGKQHTLVLVDEWLPPSPEKSRDESLAEITRRYFTSHGPATARDFSWWSGLPLSDVKTGIDIIRDELETETINGVTFWFVGSAEKFSDRSVHLLPSYDEFTIGYTDRSAVLDQKHAVQTRNGIFSSVVVHRERIAGTWSRSLTKDEVNVEVKTFAKTQPPGLKKRVDAYGKFCNRKARLTHNTW